MRLLSRIGKPSADEQRIERLRDAIVLPAYCQAWRKKGEITVVITEIKIIKEGFGRIFIRGHDRGKTWSWEAEYRRDGEISSYADVGYAGPYRIYPGFVIAAFKGNVYPRGSPCLYGTSGKNWYDTKTRELIASGDWVNRGGAVKHYEDLGGDWDKLGYDDAIT